MSLNPSSKVLHAMGSELGGAANSASTFRVRSAPGFSQHSERTSGAESNGTMPGAWHSRSWLLDSEDDEPPDNFAWQPGPSSSPTPQQASLARLPAANGPLPAPARRPRSALRAPGAGPPDAQPTALKPCVLPSFALREANLRSRSPAISAPVQNLPVSMQARLSGVERAVMQETIYTCVSTRSLALFEHRLIIKPGDASLWHPEGYNLLHRVVAKHSPKHVEIVLRACNQLSDEDLVSVRDGVAQDGLDAVQMAIKRQSMPILTQLLDAGCNFSRRYYRSESHWAARSGLPRPIDNAAVFAIRQRNIGALDKLLLQDEARQGSLPQSHLLFDVAVLMTMTTGFGERLKDAMMDVLHAAVKRRSTSGRTGERLGLPWPKDIGVPF